MGRLGASGSGSGSWQSEELNHRARGERGPVSKRDQEETLELNKTHTKFVFFKASPDESTVGVVYSFLAGTMRCRMQNEIATAPARPRNDGSPLRQPASGWIRLSA